MSKSKKIAIESKLWILNVSIRDEKLGYGKLAKIFQEKTGRTINRSSIRKICLNKDELLRGLLRQNSFYDFLRKEVVAVTFQTGTPKTPIRQSGLGNLKRKKHSQHKLIKFEAILNCEVLDAFRRANVNYNFIKRRAEDIQKLFPDETEVQSLRFGRSWYRKR